jgi:predicted SAM-dependent methyltransferase
MRYLNLGCGSRFHPTWTNLDVISSNAAVRACDLSKGIPFPDNSFQVVYHSHLLEHFPKDKAFELMQECRRVLETGGVIRVAVPDLEQIVRMYLKALELSCQGDETWQHNYEWLMIQLYDQAVREQSGGAFLKYLQRGTIPNEDFVCSRSGEARRIIQQFRGRLLDGSTAGARTRPSWRALRAWPRVLRAAMLRVILGEKDYAALGVARFRSSGEIHHWMYDQYSLATLLRRAGFADPKRFDASESRIPGWVAYNLDTEPDGAVYKPDSLYMEAVKA